MRVDQARALRPGNKVFIDYTPNNGHGSRVYCAGTVEGTYANAPASRNSYDVEFISVSVKYQGMRSVFPSFCLSKL